MVQVSRPGCDLELLHSVLEGGGGGVGDIFKYPISDLSFVQLPYLLARAEIRYKEHPALSCISCTAYWFKKKKKKELCNV